jgi:hypothetical protein
MTAATAPEPTAPEPRTLRSDFDWLRAQLAAAVVDRPLAAAATAAGIGFVLGGGLTRPTISVLVQTGSRVAATWLGSALQPPGLAHDGAATEEDPR